MPFDYPTLGLIKLSNSWPAIWLTSQLPKSSIHLRLITSRAYPAIVEIDKNALLYPDFGMAWNWNDRHSWGKAAQVPYIRVLRGL